MKINTNIENNTILMSEMEPDSIGVIVNSDIPAYNGLIVMRPKHIDEIICIGEVGDNAKIDNFSLRATHPVRLFKRGESFTVTF